jgi:hypothetical protein
MRQPKPFIVIQNGKPIFTIHACSLEKTAATHSPHPEEPRSGVSKDGHDRGLMVRDGACAPPHHEV